MLNLVMEGVSVSRDKIISEKSNRVKAWRRRRGLLQKYNIHEVSVGIYRPIVPICIMYMYVMTGAFLDNRSNVINMYEEERTAFQKYNEKS